MFLFAFGHAETKKFPDIGLSFELPGDGKWTGGDTVDLEKGSGMIAFSSKDGHRIQIEYSSTSESLETSAKAYFDRTRDSSNATVNSEKEFTIDKHPARKARIAIEAPNEVRNIIAIVTVIDGHSYVFLLHPADVRPLEEQEVFDTIIASVQLQPSKRSN